MGVFAYLYYPTDSSGCEIRDQFGMSARKRFASLAHCKAYAHVMRLRYPHYKIEKQQFRKGGVHVRA